MQTQVKTWGNSQGIRIPKEVLQEANVKINDVLDVRVAAGMIMLVKPFRHKGIATSVIHVVDVAVLSIFR